MPPRLTRAALALGTAVALTLSAGCRGGETDPPAPPPSSADTQACPEGPGSGQAAAGGPLQLRNQKAVTFGRAYIKPGTVQDAGVIELFNNGTTTVRINAVALVPDPHASQLTFRGAFVQPSTKYLEFKPARNRGDYQPANGYCLPPTEGDSPPVLVLRVGPALPAQASGHTVSRNNSVNIDYTTQDGRRYVAAYPYRFEYPNHRNG